MHHQLLQWLPFCCLLMQLDVAVSGPPITAVAIAPNEQQVLLGSQSGIEVRSWPTLEVQTKLATELTHVHDLAFSPDGQHLLAAGGSPAESGSVELFSWPRAAVVKRLDCHDDSIMRARWSSDGKHWLTASADGSCKSFSVESDVPLAMFRGHSRSVTAACFLSDNQTVVSGSVDQTLQLWDCKTGSPRRKLNNHTADINDIAVRVAVSGELASNEASAAPLQTIASVSDDYTLRIWQPTIGRLVRFVKLPSIARALVWSSADQHWIAGCDDGCVRILDADTLEIKQTLTVLTGPIYDIAIGAQGKRLIVAGVGAPAVIEL